MIFYLMIRNLVIAHTPYKTYVLDSDIETKQQDPGWSCLSSINL